MVCTANICRSPLAEHLLRTALAAPVGVPPEFLVSSAGIRAWAGAEMDPMSAAELRRRGGDPTAFRARQLSRRHADEADLILAMTAEHRTYVLQEEPRLLRRTFTLLEFAALVSDVPRVREAQGDPARLVRAASEARGAARLEEYDVQDPFGRSALIHHQVAETIGGAVQTVGRALVP